MSAGVRRHVRGLHQVGASVGFRHGVVVQADGEGDGRRAEERARVVRQRVGGGQGRAGREAGIRQFAVLDSDRREHGGRRAGADRGGRGRRRRVQAAGGGHR